MTLNVKKCGCIAPSKSGGAAHLNGEEVPRVEDYTYTDFYMTGAGIAFTNTNWGGISRCLSKVNRLDLGLRIEPSPAL